MTPAWQILTFGGLALRRDGAPVASGSTQPRRLALLAMLASAGERGMSRERILATLWPDTDPEKSRRLLTQAVYVLRRDFGDEEALAGTRELALNPELVDSDARRFARAVKEGHDEDAVALYEGPFLEGFRLPAVAEFERWQEEERTAYARQAAKALERLAARAGEEGRARDALGWWQRLASFDPLDGRVALELMRAFVAAGDALGAIRHARVHEELVRQMLELPGDREVAAYAEELRTTLAEAPVPASAVVAEPVRVPTDVPPPALENGPDAEATGAADTRAVPATPEPSDTAATGATGAGPAPLPGGVAPRRRTPAWVWGALGAGAVFAAVVALTRTRPDPTGGDLLAIGEIADYLERPDSRAAAALSDMLATNLARVDGVNVLSAARMLEMAPADLPRAGSLASAARRAGATTVIEGGLHDAADGGYRLDLRLVRLDGGEVLAAFALEGPDLFALADSGTSRVAARLGGRAPRGSIREVTTASELAYTLYREGLRLFFAGDLDGARAILDAALREDPAFAVAAYWRAAPPFQDPPSIRLALAARADTLAEHAPDRERWVIRARLASQAMDPRLRAYADSLVARYPEEPEGWELLAISLVADGRHAEAIPVLRRALADLGPDEAPNPVVCRTCALYEILATAYTHMDSTTARVRAAEAWVGDYPDVPAAWRFLAVARAGAGAHPAADSARARAFALDGAFETDRGIGVALAVARGDLDAAARTARSAGPDLGPNWWLASWVDRARERWDDALDAARRERSRSAAVEGPPGSADPAALSLATTLRMAGRPDQAAALFDSLAAWRIEGAPRILTDRQRGWMLVQRADALFEAGRTSDLDGLADEVERLGSPSLQLLDRRVHWHVRGLAALARADTADALDAFARSVFSLPQGYTRTNQVWARVLLALDRPEGAIPLLQAALRGSIEGSSFFANPAETHRLLAEAWSRIPGIEASDSAEAHATSGPHSD